ncbi:hypothetical protein FOA43_002992 [Brettanomyces nanus]|uniref:CAP-Gly domain-containing protein n=1 Tax=Eeniella nana TaxID=13502 RepID=A0A875S5K3_EENNA|nr:uncharacterized protein FOA43_002992 [Brettanomyces nanus]QPG75635.1 hypothetical protein FOA43_002992 [Brettanomyces nanus]
MESLMIGSLVRVQGGHEALLKYIGPVKNKQGTFAGVELQGELQDRGKNSGDANGIRYFDTAVPMSGLFIPFWKLLQMNGVRESPERMNMSAPRSLRSPTPMRMERDEEIEHLRDEIESLKVQNGEITNNMRLYEQKLAERSKILQELEATVSSFDPMLAEYDRQLDIEEERFVKYKESTDNQIKELLDAIELMEQQEMYMRKMGGGGGAAAKAEAEEGGRRGAEENIKDEKDEQIEQLKEKVQEKDKQINELRKIEMNNYKLEMKIEELEAEVKVKGDDNEIIKELEEERSKKDEEIEKIKKNGQETIKKLENKVKKLEETVKLKSDQVESNELGVNETDERINELEKELTAKERMLSQRDEVLQQRGTMLLEKVRQIEDKDKLIRELETYKEGLERQVDTGQRQTGETRQTGQRQTGQRQTGETRQTSRTRQTAQTPQTPQTPPTAQTRQTRRLTTLVNTDGKLEVYRPESKADPTAGREKWCGLCERPGHESIDCPYDDGVF